MNDIVHQVEKKTVDERHFYYHAWTVELRADLGGLDTMTINDAYLAVHKLQTLTFGWTGLFIEWMNITVDERNFFDHAQTVKYWDILL